MAKEEFRSKGKCFVIMPISDPEGYEKGHFRCVYEDLFEPAIKDAGYDPVRADDNKSSNMIQESIIRTIIESPMAICDLSTRNPNVLFELGIRQAFDLPVVLVQEENTPRIFDISTINTIDYRKTLGYREVISDREKICSAIEETFDGSKGINSIIKLLDIGKASLDNASLTKDEEIKMLLMSLGNRMTRMEKTINNYIGDQEEWDWSVLNKGIDYKDNNEIKIYLNNLIHSNKKIKVYEVAKMMGISSEEVLDILSKNGIEMKSHMSSLTSNEIIILRNNL